LHLLADSVVVLTFGGFFGLAEVELLLLCFCGHRVDRLLKRCDELVQLVSLQVALGHRDGDFNRDAVTKLVPRVVLVQHLQCPLRMNSEAVVGRAGHLQHGALVCRNLTLLVWHVVAPGAVALLDRGGHREVDHLREILLGWNSLAMCLEDLEGTNLLGLFPTSKTVMSCTHIATEEKSHLNLLHSFFTLSVI